MLDGKSHLNEPVENLVFTVADSADFLLISNLSVEITAISVVHDDAEAPLIHKRLLVGDDIRMAHSFEHMYLINRVLALLSIHLAHVDDLHNVGVSVGD